MLAYTTGVAAGVGWPEGDVATRVAAVIEGRKPSHGALVTVILQSAAAADMVPGTYLYMGAKPSGELFFDSSGGQNAAGH